MRKLNRPTFGGRCRPRPWKISLLSSGLRRRRPARGGRRARAIRLSLEALEERTLLAGLVVNDAGGGGDYDLDDGVCSATFHFEGPLEDPIIVPNEDCTFEAAADNAASSPGADTITFAIPAGSTVTPFSDVDIGDDTTVDAPAGKIVVSRLGSGRGVVAGSGNTIRNLVFNDMVTGIVLNGDNNLVVGNHLGVDLAGTAASGITVGIRVHGNNNTVGGTAAGTRNIISGNTSTGVTIGGTDNVLIGNFIGTDISGTQALGNIGLGVDLLSPAAVNNTIGGEGDAANVISANNIGIILRGASSNTIIGNKIGTDVTGTQGLGNPNVGIWVQGSGNTIGGTEGMGNVISDNGTGVLIQVQGNTVAGNRIGTDASGTLPLGNTVSGVRINTAPNNTIGGEGDAGNLISGNRVGLLIDGATATGNLVAGNKFGTDVTGTARVGNIEAIQVFAPDNVIGGDPPGGASGIVGNVISGSLGDPPSGIFGTGVHLVGALATGNLIQGNLIGTDVTGMVAIPNQADGVGISAAGGNFVGGTTSAARNVISGNAGDGVFIGAIAPQEANGNFVEGNYIGVDVTGMTALPNGFRGVHIDSSASNNTIGGESSGARNIISGNGSDGVIIALAGATNNVVTENYIGTDKEGTGTIANMGSGVFIFEAPGNFVGKSTGTNFARNVISGNTEHGVKIEGVDAAENVVAGNLIGTDKNGTADLPNAMHGVYILNAPLNRVGDVFDGPPSHLNFPGNVIAAKMAGVRIEGADATQNQVLRNLIGVDITGTRGFSTVAEAGVHLLDAPNNRIGVSLASPSAPGGNTVSHNLVGIHIQSLAPPAGTGTIGGMVGGNFIGTDHTGLISLPTSQLGNRGAGVFIENSENNFIGGQPTGMSMLPGNKIAGNGGDGVRIIGDAAKGNVIGNNSIGANDLLGIDLGGDGVTPNDTLDEDMGPNMRQNAPFVSPVALEGGVDRIVGTLESKPNMLYRIEFFDAFNPDETGFGEGDIFLGAQDVTTDGTGVATIDFVRTTAPLDGRSITATATDTSGNTSEFSCAVPALVGDGSPGQGRFFGVTTTDDDGPGSLRRAILDANANAGLDTIRFCLGAGGPHTISPLSPLPTIIDPVIIDGTTQLGAQCNTSGPREASNAVLQVELNGANAGSGGAHGLVITAGGSTVRGLVINRFLGSAIRLEQNGGNHIECNYLGTDVAGTAKRPNLNGVGIKDSPDNTIGGTRGAARNLISGNLTFGVSIDGSASLNNVVAGNFIGTNADGTGSLGNGTGVFISDASSNRIGDDGEWGNLISGNDDSGVDISDLMAPLGDTILNTVMGNYIGTNASGTGPVPNQVGVSLSDVGFNAVGGIITGEFSNLISGNTEAGVDLGGVEITINNVVLGNRIGTNAAGTDAVPNGAGVILGLGASNNTIGGNAVPDRNLISGNTGNGILVSGGSDAPASMNLIIGNFIGTDRHGASPIANLEGGVRIEEFAESNKIGGMNAGERNIISGNVKNGVTIVGPNAKLNQVLGNFIGTNHDGTRRVRNEDAGVLIDGAPDNTIGIADTAFSNVISGNAIGVHIKGAGATGNRVLHNLIGTDVNGTAPLGNDEAGVRIEAASMNFVGGAAQNEGNVISANSQFGVHVLGPAADQNFVGGNLIGTDPQGNGGADPEFAPLGNLEAGVLITDATNTRVGVAAANALTTDACTTAQLTRNTIAGNLGVGVRVAGASAAANVIRCNVIRDNESIGIDLVGGDTPARPVTGNDTDDADAGPNGLLNFPVGVTYLTDPPTGDVTITGSVRPGSNVIVDLYGLPATIENMNEGPDPLGFGEGQVYLHSVVPPASGDFSVVLAGGLPPGFPFVSATATSLADGSTSEFSAVCGYLDADDDGNPDTDGDSLCDDWETKGIDFNGDGTVDLNLPLLTDSKNKQHQADPTVKDIFVEVDWMDCAIGGCAANHASHEPVAGALTDVEAAFTNQNIRLHLMPDESLREITSIRFTNGGVRTPPDGTFNDLKVGSPENRCGTGANDGHFGTMAERAQLKPDGTPNCENILGARRLAFRYLIFGHDHAHRPGSSGIGELPGNDFMVTLGSWSAEDQLDASGLGAGKTPDEYRQVIEAGTIMHEMGHTLNLKHGGIDHVNCKPNYLSIMSYSFQFPILDTVRPLDYSDTALGTLNEEHLNEAAGINGPANRKVFFGIGFTGKLPAMLPAANGAIDWDGDGNNMEADVEADVNMLLPKSACRPKANDSVVAFTDFPGSPNSEIRGNLDFANGQLVGFVVTMLSGAASGQHRIINANSNMNRFRFPDFANPVAVGDSYVIHRPPDVLPGHDDWENLMIPFRQTNDYADGVSTATESDDVDMTVDDFLDAARSFDFDADGFSNFDDNCPAVPNPAQADTNGDGVPDACSPGIQVLVNGDTLQYVALASQVNRAAFAPQAATAIVGEATELILEAGNACAGGGLPSATATCDLAGVARIDVTLDDGDDTVDVGPFDIPVLIHAGLGNDTLRLTGAGHALNLVLLGNTDLQGLETIDIQGSGPNSLTLDVDEVVNLSDTNELAVLAGPDDTVKIGDGWVLTQVTIQAGLFFHVLKQNGARLLLNGPKHWQHPLNRHDVNNNGVSVDPVGDILALINEVNAPKIIDATGRLPDAATVSDELFRFYDVNGDGFLSAVGDILAQINEANRQADGEGEARYLLPGPPIPNSSFPAPPPSDPPPLTAAATDPHSGPWQPASQRGALPFAHAVGEAAYAANARDDWFGGAELDKLLAGEDDLADVLEDLLASGLDGQL